MPDYTQELHRISIKTPLGEDKLYLRSFDGEEEFSRLFRYTLELLSDDPWIDPKTIVGENVTVEILYPDDSVRYFNGVISRFTYLGTGDRMSQYRAEMVPELWFLTRSADCRIFQDMKIPDIIEDVFSTLGFTKFKLNLTGSYPEREYCVQYRETAFNFVSRLMEQYGIFYYFTHTDGEHTMVLGDSTSAYEDSDEKEVTYRRNVANQFDFITGWEHRFEYRTGKWAHTDYNFETPKTELLANANTMVDLTKNKDYEVFDFPGEYTDKDEADREVKLRMEEEEVPHDVVNGTSICRSFSPGTKFTMSEHISPDECGKSYVLTSVHHSARIGEYWGGGSPGEATYTNSFTCVPDSVVIRPARISPKPIIQGSQTAVVVGPPGEEIYPDEYGRVKVQFFWDRYGKKDDTSSCWIRCMQNSAGRNWGSMSIPRIGQEVVVSYLEGDPDRPLVTGQVYNADQMPAYSLPDEKTKTYIKTNSSSGGDGYNELRFEDKSGEEQIFIHAEKDIDTRIKNDSREHIEGNRHLTIGSSDEGGDQVELIYKDKHQTVKGDQKQKIEGNYELMVGSEGGKMDMVISDKETKKVGSGGSHVTVEGDYNNNIGGSMSHEVGSDHNEKVGMGYALDAGQSVHIKGGMNVVIEAGAQLTLKVGGNFVSVSQMGVDIKGIMVNINSGGAAGSGSGANPTSPDTATEASPLTPDEADNSQTGQKSSD